MSQLEASILGNYERIQEKVRKAAESTGRSVGEICTVVVSKSQPEDVIRAAYSAGIRTFGENYPQEAEQKIKRLVDLEGIAWHMIGHLQSRKSVLIARNFQMIHSVDNLQHAQKLDIALKKENKRMPALLELNVGGEESKFGWKAETQADWERLLPEISLVLQLPNLVVNGLMTMPPLTDQPELSRTYFRCLCQAHDFLNRQYPNRPFSILSMGTSADFEVAIQEGATMVRVGRAILGPRPPRKQGEGEK
jgi:pyridoxal phosphate enzyme (YggS family)